MEITREYLREHFDYDAGTGLLHRRSTGLIADLPDSKGYSRVKVSRKYYRAHRLVWMYFHGAWPDHIDHINGVRWDNRLENLRSVTSSGNGRNAAICSNNTSGVTGVSLCGTHNKWASYISTNSGPTRLYWGQDFFEACCRRKAAELKLNYTGRVK